MLAVLAAGPAARSQGPAPRDLPPPIATRQLLFSIPFRVDRTPQQGAAQVELHVSGDRGQTWKLYSRTDPAKNSFLFRAANDGEFWFQIRTIDAQGRGRPLADRPGLRVIVDTVPPRLDLQAQGGQAGQIAVGWQILETNLNPRSLKLQYRGDAFGPWQTVAVDPRSFIGSGPEYSGEVSWVPPSLSGPIEIRCEVADMAGNVGVSHSQVGGSPAATAPGDGPPRPNRTAEMPLTDPRTGEAAGIPAPVNPPIGNRPATDVPRRGGDETSASSTVNRPAPAATLPRGGAGIPPGERPRMINTLRFELDYDVGSVGPGGVGEVELWGTRDFGRTWQSYGRTRSAGNVFQTAVREEGLYGFRVSVRGRAGEGGQPPQAGSLPDVWIGVDLARPACRLVGAEQTGPRGEKLLLRWEAEDRYALACRAVSLLFSTTPGGPWSPVALGLENTGQYAWPIDSRLPDRLFFRLEVRDEAGNIGAFETPEPVKLQLTPPAARVLGLHELRQ